MDKPATSTSSVEITGLADVRGLRARLLRELRRALGSLTATPVRATVRFVDDDGPKGGIAVRCTMNVSVPYRPVVRVEHVAQTPRLAFDGGLATLSRRLERYRELQREGARRPKKYFAARRLREGG